MCWPEAIFSRQWRLVESWFHRFCHAGCEELYPRTGLQSFIGFAAALGGKRKVGFAVSIFGSGRLFQPRYGSARLHKEPTGKAFTSEYERPLSLLLTLLRLPVSYLDGHRKSWL